MEILYRIEILSHSLLVHLEEKGSRRLLYLDTLKKLAQEKDQAALALLVKIHLRSPHVSRSLDTVVFQKIEVPATEASEVLRLMALTGRLYHRNRSLTVDLQKPISCIFRGEKHSEKECTLSAHLQTAQGELSLADCEALFPGSPSWFLKEGKIWALQTKVSWKWLECFLKGPLRLEGLQQKKFLEEDVEIFWKERPLPKALEVFPRLMLTDANGSFANLWMDYPDVGTVDWEDFSPTVNGKNRLKEAELHWEKDLLETGYARKIVGHSHYYCPTDQVKQALLFLLEMGWKICDQKGRTIYKQSGLSLSMTEDGAQICMQGEVFFQKQISSLKKVWEASQKGRLWVELDEGSVGLLDSLPSIDRIEGEWEGEERLRFSKSQASLLAPLLEDPQIQWEATLKKAIQGLKEGAFLESTPVGPSFQGTLLPYQQKGLDWMAFLARFGFSGLLADEMGLGKTVQVLAFFSQLRTNLPVLIVAPTSLLFNWACEIRRFLPVWKVYVHSGMDRLKTAEQLNEQACILTSYAILRLDQELLSSVFFETIVLDESNAIKTASTQTAQAAYRLQGRFKLALSGTPIENRLEELVSQFRFLMPSLLGEKRNLQPQDIPLLRRKTGPFLLRRKKEEVQLELPEKIEQIVWVEMEPEQAKIYESYRLRLKNGLLKKIEQEGLNAHRMEVLEAILRLRQICADPRLVKEETVGAKFLQLFEEVEEFLLQGRKVLIYSQFTTFLQLIQKQLKEKGIHPLYLDGTVPFAERGKRVQAFQENPQEALFLISLKAGGVGLNLTAADTVILLDPWWNEAVELQAIDRAHRIGQKKTVLAKRYLTPYSIEEKILELKKRKSAVSQELLDSEEIDQTWTQDDLLYLLSQ